jgi:hypothetical protein
MAIKFNRSQTFATNGTVTAAGLHNLIDGTDIYQALITDQTAMTSVGSLDKLLIADSDLTAGDAPRSVTVNELFEDALTLSTYTNVKAVNSLYTNATGNYTLSTGATITNGTITNSTITNGTITNGVITNGTIANLSATTSTFIGTITGSTNVVNIGSGQIYKDASGLVGIGTTSPVSGNSLTVFNSINGGIVLQNNTNYSAIAQNGHDVYFDVGRGGTAGNLYIRRSSSLTSSMTIDPSGNVGVGTTSPASKLHINGGLRVTGEVSTAGASALAMDFLSGNSRLISCGSDASTQGGFSFISLNSTSSIATEHLRIDSSGRVGIGTTSPTADHKLTISAADSRMDVTSTNTAFASLRIVSNNASYASIDAGLASDAYATTKNIALQPNGGNFGIGTTAPANKLEVVGSFGRGAPVTKTADFTLAATENWIIVNKAAATCTVTLPAASSWTGREFTIKTLQAFTVVSASSNVVPRNGTAAGTAILAAAAGNWATLVSDGTNWVIMCGS